MGDGRTRAVVIGAGLGGLSCAARLVTRGVEVTVLEAARRPGGKVGGDRWDGFTVDFVPHLFSMSTAGEIARTGQILGRPVEFVVRSPVATILLGRRTLHFPGRFDSMRDALRLAWDVRPPPLALPGIARHFANMCLGGPDLGPEDDGLTLEEWGRRYTADETYLTLLNLFSLLAFVVPYDQGSAREMGACFRRIFRGDGVGYPLGGCLGMVESLARGIEDHGGVIHYGRRVDRVETDGGRAVAVWADGQRIPADAVFSNAGVRRTCDLVGDDVIGAGYARAARALTDSLAGICIRYTLRERVIPETVLFSMPDVPPGETCRRIHDGELVGLGSGFYVTVPSNFDPGLAPPGCQVVVAGTLFYPEAAGQRDAMAMLRSMERRLEGLYPRLPDAIIRREPTGPAHVATASGRLDRGEAVGVAQTPRQSGGARPRWRTPVRGLFVVGADTGSGAIGTELAAGSGLAAAEDALGPLGPLS